MTVLCVPELEERPWPTLGPAVVEFAETWLTHGPGDLRGEPLRLSNEQKAFLYRVYEVHPICSCWGKRLCTHQSRPARRRFNRAALSLRKGLAKTELGAVITFCELHPDAPVRAVNWWKPRGGDWEPEGAGVKSPYIPVLATTEEQVADLGYGVLLDMAQNSPLARDFDIGLERIMRRGGDGQCQPMSSAPNSKDGALTTYQWFDETHRIWLPNQKHAHQTMLANMAKRPLADPWSLETTTSFSPGQGSIAEDTMEYARQIADGRASNPRLFFFHREASEGWDLSKPDQLRGAIVEASGAEAAAWSDIDRIASQWDDPTQDKAYLERVWLNRATGLASRAFDVEVWKKLSVPKKRIEKGRLVTLGFDGSLVDDATVLVATDVEDGFQQVVGFWENAKNERAWKVPKEKVEAAVQLAFDEWEVWRMYADPPHWEDDVARWAGRFGEKVVVEFRTNRWSLMGRSLAAYGTAMAEGSVTNDGHEGMARHIGNAVRVYTSIRGDDRESFLWIVEKERKDSEKKIDAAVAGCLSWQARLDAVAAGATASKGFEPRVWGV